MNMIYAALLCYANGNCIVPNGDPVFTYFNSLAACERQVQIENQGHLRSTNMRAVCFEKSGWQPVSKPPPIAPLARIDVCGALAPQAQEQCRRELDPEPANEMELDGQ